MSNFGRALAIGAVLALCAYSTTLDSKGERSFIEPNSQPVLREPNRTEIERQYRDDYREAEAGPFPDGNYPVRNYATTVSD